MALRTVRLDQKTEETLQQICQRTGMPMSEVFKRGIRAVEKQLCDSSEQRPFDLYQSLDLGPGGYARAASTDALAGVTAAIRKKLGHK